MHSIPTLPRTWLTVLIFGLMFAFSGSASAQDIKTKEGLVIKHDSKWEAGTPAKGVSAVLRSTVDKKAQIEFRTAGKMDGDKATQFFKSFHTNLQNAGLKVQTKATEKTYGALKGMETEYVTKSAKGNFRLVVFQFHDAKLGAWLMVGFFSERQREIYYPQFTEVLGQLVVAAK